MFQLDGKVAIITGAAGGIGGEAARLFASLGARLVLADIDRAGVEQVAQEIDPGGKVARAVHVDLGDEVSIKAMVEFAVDCFGSVDVIDNNAALLSRQAGPNDRNVENVPVELWDNMFRINARGTMLCCKYVLPVMRAKGGGSIINTASNLGMQGGSERVAYSATKAAIIQMTRSIAASHGKDGIRCNSISPGLVTTEKARTRLPEKLWSIVEAETLTPYIGAPADIANVVAFLASDASRYITGANIVADGGTFSHVAGYAALKAMHAAERKE